MSREGRKPGATIYRDVMYVARGQEARSDDLQGCNVWPLSHIPVLRGIWTSCPASREGRKPGATIYRDVMYGRSRTSLCSTALGHPVRRRGGTTVGTQEVEQCMEQLPRMPGATIYRDVMYVAGGRMAALAHPCASRHSDILSVAGSDDWALQCTE